MKKAFVCGHPIAHSRSPKIHGYWLKTYGIAGSYEAIDVAPQDAAGFFATLKERGFAGGNVTIPHKEAAFAAVARRDEAAEKIGAVNTLWFEDGVLCGGNTDAAGFAANLDERAPGWATSRRGGGAWRRRRGTGGDPGAEGARLHRHQGDEPDGRAGSRAGRPLRRGRVGACLRATRELLGDAGLLVNTTALGMAGRPVRTSCRPIPTCCRDSAIVTDIVYVPLETPLLAAARRRGLKTVDGLGMLLHQAVPGFERWFGRRPEVTAELRAMIVADMEA